LLVYLRPSTLPVSAASLKRPESMHLARFGESSSNKQKARGL
jgi:hypothetical protein